MGQFIEATKPSTNVPQLMGETYEAMKGLNVLLKSVDAAQSHKLSGAAGLALGLGAAGAMGLGAAGAGAMGAGAVAAGLASFGALSVISSHSPLKSMLGHLGKNLSPSAHKALTNKIGDYMSRMGFFAGEDGMLDVKETKGK